MRALLPAILVIVTLCAGCGGYASSSEAFRKSLTRGEPEEALTAVNEALGVDRAEQLPSEQTADTPLLLIERATILQALTDYKLSSRDFQLADKQLEVLDVTSDTSGSIAKYMFSDDSTVYKGPPHEKLLINTLNLINYLALGDDSGAKVEARRFTINRKYFADRGDKGRGLMALGSYLAGFAFEVAGESGAAIRHYGDSADAGGLPLLAETVRNLAARSGETDSRLDDMIDANATAPDDDNGDLLIIVQTGMAPYRYPERMPIGAAVVAASSPGPGARVSSADRHRANVFAAKGILKWINIPGLKASKGRAGSVGVRVDDRRFRAPVGLDIRSRVIDEFERAKGSLVAASLTRMLTRAVAGELTQAATSKKNSPLGLLLGLAVEGALTAADTPDTRGWVTLPGEIRLLRTRVAPGKHEIAVSYRGVTRVDEIEMKKNGWAVLNFSALR